jgi:3-methyladenine DNA glycosylase AlkC
MRRESVASFLGPSGICRIAADIESVTAFPSARFIRLASNGIGSLRLFARANHIASALDDVLRMPFSSVARVLVDASGPPRCEPGYGPMENFRFLAFTRLISRNGIPHLSESMTALKQLTKRFTSEFDVRPFLLSAESNTLKFLGKWVEDEDFHVRRLVSESTRSRLPWGVHLESFKQDPSKVAPLIEKLNADSVRYVRISVANNLADIIKDNPEYGLSMAERWAAAAHPYTSKLIHHAVRFPAKRGDKRALALRIPKN